MEHIDLLLPLVLILVTARLASMVSRRLGMPAVLGELLAGLILGPSLLGWVSMNSTLGSVADIGVLLLMFIAGLETDLLQMRQVGKASLFTAVAASCCLSRHGVGFALEDGPLRQHVPAAASRRPASAYRCRCSTR